MVSVKLEPALTIPLTEPQSQIYDVGGGQAMKVLVALTSYLDIGPTVSLLVLPAAEKNADSGIAWGFGGGLRFKAPRVAERHSGMSPWLDFDLLYVRTGGLNRPAFDVAAGLAFPLGEAHALWVGPFVRYMQTDQPARAADRISDHPAHMCFRADRAALVGVMGKAVQGASDQRQPRCAARLVGWAADAVHAAWEPCGSYPCNYRSSRIHHGVDARYDDGRPAAAHYAVGGR